METKLSESEIQREVDALVGREVIYCASSLVYELGQKEGIYLFDEFPDLYQGGPSYGLWTCGECNHDWQGEPEVETGATCSKCNSLITEDDFEPEEYHEIFEHWIVSEWLASRLEEQGESVERDFYGLTIWGRAAYGQAISLDGVIRQIWGNLQNA